MFLRRRAATALPRAAAGERLLAVASSIREASSGTHNAATTATAATAWFSCAATTRERRAVQLADCTMTQRRHVASQATATAPAGSAAASQAAESPVASLTDVPAEVMQRVVGHHQTMRRLLRLGAGQTAVPRKSIEEVFERQIGLGCGDGNPATKPAATAAATDKVASVPRHLVSMAIWRVLQHDCYFTRKQVSSSSSTTTTTGMSVAAAAAAAAAARGVSDQGLCVVPLSWRLTLERLAASIPYEGWTETEVLAYMRSANPIWAAFPPLWLPAYGSGAPSFEVFVREHFPMLLTITRSAVTGELLFHTAGHSSVAVTWRRSAGAGAEEETGHVAVRPSEVCDAVQHALHTLGRGHQLPLWTDVTTVAPLLPAQTGLSSPAATAWNAAFAQHAELRGCFRLEAYVRVRASTLCRRWTVVVDSTTLTPADVTALLTTAAAGKAVAGAAAPPASVKLLRRAGTPRESYEQACCAAAGPATLVHDVVVDALLEPQHLLAALVESVVAEVEQEEPEAAAKKAMGGTPEARVHDLDGDDADAAAAAVTEDDAVAEEDEGDADEAEAPTPSLSPIAPAAASASANSSATPVLVLCGASAKEAFAAVLEDVRSPLVAVSVVTPEADA